MNVINNNEREQAWNSVERMFAVIVFTPEGNVLDANPVFLGALGYSLVKNLRSCLRS